MKRLTLGIINSIISYAKLIINIWGCNGFDGKREHLRAGSGAEPLKNP